MSLFPGMISRFELFCQTIKALIGDSPSNPLYKSSPLYPKIQCKKYRSQFTEEKKAIYEEKLEASKIFKDKKALYPTRYEQAFTTNL